MRRRNEKRKNRYKSILVLLAGNNAEGSHEKIHGKFAEFSEIPTIVRNDSICAGKDCTFVLHQVFKITHRGSFHGLFELLCSDGHHLYDIANLQEFLMYPKRHKNEKSKETANPLTDNSPIVKSVKESSSQLGLVFKAEE